MSQSRKRFLKKWGSEENWRNHIIKVYGSFERYEVILAHERNFRDQQRVNKENVRLIR